VSAIEKIKPAVTCESGRTILHFPVHRIFLPDFAYGFPSYATTGFATIFSSVIRRKPIGGRAKNMNNLSDHMGYQCI